MVSVIKLLHLAAAVVWLGGIAFMLFALRPAAHATLAPPQRLPLIAETLRRFFVAVWASIAVLLASGFAMLVDLGFANAPLGWHLMFGIGLVMFALFAHLFFVPYRRLQRAVGASDWPAGGAQTLVIARLAMANFALGWIAIAAMRFVR